MDCTYKVGEYVILSVRSQKTHIYPAKKRLEASFRKTGKDAQCQEGRIHSNFAFGS